MTDQYTPPTMTKVDPTTLRTVLGQFASGVVVVTAAGPEGPIGFTCQSFTSLSLEPPLVSFAPARTSKTWPQIREIGTFCVNILADDHEHHSNQFARSGGDKFAGVEWTPAPDKSPILAGVCAWAECTLEMEYPGGDHTIVLGRVRDLDARPPRNPLIFHRGSYGLPDRKGGPPTYR
ncbi:flavin reductase family protein (plasmid) [Rhodococcus sp. USK10]|uniref:flavin reductase family protein n=1 Tax=Rhodococcus sp. USK10 TaxID=2789739 RepID=UPI001C5E6065|nr:flavin reductase family protein [Rhodococcus sp. USK10]QYB00146.1 flavin reductase family protein [Rhodococcus sp. USK10]